MKSFIPKTTIILSLLVLLGVSGAIAATNTESRFAKQERTYKLRSPLKPANTPFKSQENTKQVLSNLKGYVAGLEKQAKTREGAVSASDTTRIRTILNEKTRSTFARMTDRQKRAADSIALNSNSMMDTLYRSAAGDRDAEITAAEESYKATVSEVEGQISAAKAEADEALALAKADYKDAKKVLKETYLDNRYPEKARLADLQAKTNRQVAKLHKAKRAGKVSAVRRAQKQLRRTRSQISSVQAGLRAERRAYRASKAELRSDYLESKDEIAKALDKKTKGLEEKIAQAETAKKSKIDGANTTYNSAMDSARKLAMEQQRQSVAELNKRTAKELEDRKELLVDGKEALVKLSKLSRSDVVKNILSPSESLTKVSVKKFPSAKQCKDGVVTSKCSAAPQVQ